MAFYLLYGTSKKISAIRVLGMEKWSAEHRKTSKLVSLALMMLSLGLSWHYWGLGSGTFAFFILLMTVISLVVMLAPLCVLNYRFLGILFLCSIFFETLLF